MSEKPASVSTTSTVQEGPDKDQTTKAKPEKKEIDPDECFLSAAESGEEPTGCRFVDDAFTCTLCGCVLRNCADIRQHYARMHHGDDGKEMDDNSEADLLISLD